MCGGVTHPNLSVYSYIFSVSSLGPSQISVDGEELFFRGILLGQTQLEGMSGPGNERNGQLELTYIKATCLWRISAEFQVPKPLYQTGNHVLSCVL